MLAFFGSRWWSYESSLILPGVRYHFLFCFLSSDLVFKYQISFSDQPHRGAIDASERKRSIFHKSFTEDPRWLRIQNLVITLSEEHGFLNVIFVGKDTFSWSADQRTALDLRRYLTSPMPSTLASSTTFSIPWCSHQGTWLFTAISSNSVSDRNHPSASMEHLRLTFAITFSSASIIDFTFIYPEL